MFVRAVSILAVCAGLSLASGQSCQVLLGEASRLFELTDTFGDDAVLKPFDDEGVFPWWVLRPAEPVAVIESVEIAKTSEGYSALLDAQYLDGNDLIASVPVDARLVQTWGCADENAVAVVRR